MMVKKCVCFIDDSMLYDHRHTATGMPFTTFDVDNDKNSGNCAVFSKGDGGLILDVIWPISLVLGFHIPGYILGIHNIDQGQT